MSWLHHDWNHRKTHAYDLICKLRLGFISKAKLQELVLTDLRGLPECVQLITGILHPKPGSEEKKTQELYKVDKPRGIISVSEH